jgi:tetratricopeptide (TPR) repeat protein
MHRQILFAGLGLILLSGCGQLRPAETWIERAKACLRQDDLQGAVAACTEAIQLEPNNADAYYFRGMANERWHEWAAALSDYRVAAKLDGSGYNRLAWVLCTCPDASLRNGEEALALAHYVRQGPSRTWAWPLEETLAAAYAELGQFEAAVEVQEYALGQAIADEAEEDELADLEMRLKLYQEKQPYRQKDRDEADTQDSAMLQLLLRRRPPITTSENPR